MERLQILARYDWADGHCFRHPGKGEVPTALVGIIRPRGTGVKEVRGCTGCVITIEDMRREQAGRTGSEYRPGPVRQRVK